MRLDRGAIALLPQTTSGCLDMAVMFFGRHLRAVLGLWFLVAAPSCLLVYALSNSYEIGLWMPALVVLFATAPLGVFLGVGAAERVLGQPMTARRTAIRALRVYGKQLLAVTALRIPMLLGLIFCVLPGIAVGVQRGFSVENAVLRRSQPQTDEAHFNKMASSEFLNLFTSALAICIFCAILAPVLFITLDMALGLLLGSPILIGRVANAIGASNAGEYVVSLLWYDPKVQTVLTAVALLVYPIGRLAWFFCYVDLQVRCDCWDIQVEFEEEALRLMQGPAVRRGEAA